MRPYRLVIEREADQGLRGLLKTVARRAITRIQELASQPRPRGTVKLSQRERGYRIRVGDYRVVYEVNDRTREVRVRYVRHRKEVYR